MIAAAAAAVSVWRSILAGRQAREARKARELSAVISLFNAYQSEGTEQIRRLIRNGKITGRLDDPEVRFQLRHYIATQNEDFARELREFVGAPDPGDAR